MGKKTAATAREQVFSSQQDGLQYADGCSTLSSDIFFTILETLDTIIFVAEIDTCQILYANPYTRFFFGNIIGKCCWQVLQSEMSEPCSFCSGPDLHDSSGRPLGPISYELHNSGSGRWYDVHERAVTLGDGSSVRIHLVTDITEKKTIDSDLLEKVEKYRTVADYTFDWECWHGEDRRVKYISPSCERITGFRADELLANPGLMTTIIHPEDRRKFSRHQEQAFTLDRYSQLDFRIITKTGEIRWISHYCQPVYGSDGTFLGRRSSNRDITESKESELRAKLNELRLTTLVKLYERKDLPENEICDFVLESSIPLTSSTIGFLGFINDQETTMSIHAWSPEVMQDCAIEHQPRKLDISTAGVWGEAVRQRRPILINDFSLSSSLKRGFPAGHVEIRRFLAVPLVIEDKVIAMLAVANKKTYYTDNDTDQLRLLLEGMWQIILRKQAEKELVRQAERTRHYANAVAHDLKSPAVSVYGFARRLKKNYHDVLDETGLQYCEQIMKYAEQISSLAEDINIFVSTRNAVYDFETVQLREIWESVGQEFFSRLRRRSITLRQPVTSVADLKANRIALLRVFRNLIDNALKYGGESLTEIVMGYELTPEHHILTVANDGERIAPEDGMIIFQEFERKPSKPQIGGTGLGLAIVREIARKHRGSSWLTVRPDGKPVFCVSLSRDL